MIRPFKSCSSKFGVILLAFIGAPLYLAAIHPFSQVFGRAPESVTDAQKESLVASNPPMIMANGVSVPSDFPHIQIAKRDQPSPGYIFINNWRDIHPFNIIFDDRGYPVWYLRTADYDRRRDFKVQKNGVITMLTRTNPQRYLGFDENFNQIDQYQAVDGYSTDEHELQVFADGSYYLVAVRTSTVDMSHYVSGGNKSAQVTESIIQGFSPDHKKIFEWRPWGHFDVADLVIDDPRASSLRFPHMNAIDLDSDGNLVLSSRHLSEITKINPKTGDIIWRLGGAHNQFTFVNDPLKGFTGQHDIRALGNNHYTLFDNGNLHQPPVSRAVEYALDTNARTATLVWEYRNPPNTSYSYYMGDAQRLPSGNTLINWAVGDRPKATEARPDGSVAYEMNFIDGYHTYRTFRFAWNGHPATPYLLIEPYLNQVALIFNKFGDAQVDYYRIYGDTRSSPTKLVDTSRTTLKLFSPPVNKQRYYFRVTAVGKDGVESGYSNEENLLVNFIPAGQNEIANGDFSSSSTSWTWTLQNSGNAQWQIKDGAFAITITNSGTNYYDVQLRQNGLSLINGLHYLFEFDAWATQPRVIEAKVGQDTDPYVNYSKIGLSALATNKKHFQYSFLMEDPSDGNARVVFNCGNSLYGVSLDNISLKQVTESGVKAQDPLSAGEYALAGNSPNPFNESTELEFTLKDAGSVTVEVYDRIGRLCKTFAPGILPAGRQRINLRMAGESSGVYFCRIIQKTPSGELAQLLHHKVLLLR